MGPRAVRETFHQRFWKYYRGRTGYRFVCTERIDKGQKEKKWITGRTRGKDRIMSRGVKHNQKNQCKREKQGKTNMSCNMTTGEGKYRDSRGGRGGSGRSEKQTVKKLTEEERLPPDLWILG